MSDQGPPPQGKGVHLRGKTVSSPRGEKGKLIHQHNKEQEQACGARQPNTRVSGNSLESLGELDFAHSFQPVISV